MSGRGAPAVVRWALLALAPVLAGALAHAGTRERTPPQAEDAAVRAQVIEQLRVQRSSIEEAAASVQQKLSAAQQAQARRVRAAVRLTRPRQEDPPLARARTRAAVAWVLARERSEVALLAEERQHLHDASARLDEAMRQAQTLELPPRTLAWPAPGEVARAFGRLTHERSGATLSRRGLDLEVEEEAPAHALAEGIVVHAGPIRGLDQGVLVQHDGYWTLVAKLSEVRVAVGDHVDPSVVLGRAARRRVYVEVRLRLLSSGLPVDPQTFLSPPR